MSNVEGYSVLRNHTTCQRLHRQYSDALRHQLRRHLLREVPELRIEYVQWHLRGVEIELVLLRQLESADG